LEPLLIWATPGQRGFGPSSSQRSNVPATQTHTHVPPTYASYRDPYSVSHKPYTPVLTPAQEATQKKLAEDTRKAAELRQILDNLEKVNDEGRRANLLDQLLSTEDVLTLPEHPNPPGIDAGNLTVNLLKHQVRIQFIVTGVLDMLTFLDSSRNKRYFGVSTARIQPHPSWRLTTLYNSGN
jgi:SWI/SNF-related matrix-associated actin-dependent regulator of chromatin subfamily A3